MTTASLAPGAWADRAALIETAFPVQKVSIEAQCERKAGAGQTLTALGSYWKGRKPLVLVRACILASLLPATDDPEADLDVLELLMAMNDGAFVHRLKSVSAEDVETWGGALRGELLGDDGKWLVKGDARRHLLGQVLARMPYDKRLDKRSLRPEELPEAAYATIWQHVNRHLGTNAHSHAELVDELGRARFGHTPRVADSFAGGGSIPFEAARLGCEVYATDLNPIACMLTWGAFNVIGAGGSRRKAIAVAQRDLAAAVDAELTRLGIEHDAEGNRAKAYLYCLETRCPETQWLVPMLPSRVISTLRRCIARLVPNSPAKRFDIEVVSNVSDAEFESAQSGTVIEGNLTYSLARIIHPDRFDSRRMRGI